MIKIVKNFLSNNEIKIMSDWTLHHYKEPYFMDPKMNDDKIQTRFTTRHAHCRSKEYKNYKINYPDEVYKVQNRLIEYLKIDEKNIIPFPAFTDGIITTICFPPGSCVRHKDPIYQNEYTLHCNFCTQKPEKGGITIINEKEYHFENKDMIMYVTSHLDHEVTEIYGKIPRILWVFGFSIKKQNLNKIFYNQSYF